MANYANLISAIQNVIKTNGNNEITGALLQQSLVALINSLGVGYQFMGIAEPTTNPGTPDQRVFYLATTPGVYSNFNAITVDVETVLFFYDNGWRKEQTGIPVLDQIIVESNDLWTITRRNGYLNASGVMTSSASFNSCQLTMDPGAMYRVVQQNTTSAGNYVRVFRFENDTYTQVWSKQTNGVDVYYTCPNDGNTYVLQAIWDLRTGVTGETQIYERVLTKELVLSLLEQVQNISTMVQDFPEADKKINALYPLFEPTENLANITRVGGFMNANGNFVEDDTFLQSLVKLENGATYYAHQNRTNNYFRVFVLSGGVYTQITYVQNVTDWTYTAPASGDIYLQLVVKLPDYSIKDIWLSKGQALPEWIAPFHLIELDITGADMWTVTKPGGYYDGNGAFVVNANLNSCQLKLFPGAKYRIVQQTTNVGGNNVRVYKLVGQTLSQVFAQKTNGTDVFYTCPNDGDVYILQAVWDLRDGTVGETQIYATMPISDWVVYLSNKVREINDLSVAVQQNADAIQQNAADIEQINDEIHSPNLWEITMQNGFYNASGEPTTNTSYDSCQIYDVVNGETYRVKMQTVTSGGGNYMRIFRVNNGVLTQVYYKQQIGGTIDYTIPNDGDSYMLQVAMRKSSGDGPAPEIYDISQDLILNVEKIGQKISDYRTIKILAIGNSYSRDAFMYFPFVLESMIPGVNITFGILYKGGCTLEEHYNYISTDADYPAFDYYYTDAQRWETVSSKNVDYALAFAEWDIILLQQRSYKSNDYTTYQPYLNDIITLLQGKLTHNVRIGWFLTPALNDESPELQEDTSDEMFMHIVAAVQQLMDETAVEFVIPCGTAIQNARTTSLKNLGDSGGLMYDNLHLQEGVPCLIESYVAAIYVAQIMGKPISVFGNQIRPDSAWLTLHHIIQQHGTPVGVNDANCYIAQKCAAIAIKKPYEITDLTALHIV